jgi:ABC-type transport system involved in cytochrome c biogenesis permease subunit
MAISSIPDNSRSFAQPDDEPNLVDFWPTLKTVLTPLASLKFTVVLFAMAIFIVLAGTFAQWREDIWDVIHGYFRYPAAASWFDMIRPSTLFAWIDFQIFFPPSFFPDHPQVPGGFYFPRGWTIGALMFVNLLAAHLLRFKIQAKGSRLIAGLAVVALGAVMTWAVIVSGSNKDGVLEAALIDWDTLWDLFIAALGAVWLASAYALVKLESKRYIERAGLLICCLALGGLLGWIIYEGDAARLGDSGMRILWQLIKASFSSVILLAGCILAFKKRAGIVLLHAGIGLMMLGELLVGTSAVETQMQIKEGQTTNFVQDIRVLELAVIDHSDPKTDDVVVVPESMLHRDGSPAPEVIRSDDLPFDVQIVEYLRNSALRPSKTGGKNLATAGLGLEMIAERTPEITGTDTGGAINLPAAYVKLTGKHGAGDIGTHLVSLEQTLRELPEDVKVGGKTYELFLRFKRIYKPYSMTLIDIRKDDYIGTSTPRNYSSDLHLVDKSRDVDRDVKIWMNNPLRFAGETFYQSNYSVDSQDKREITTLSVVSNTGWMIPYVSCMMVLIGMLAHFVVTLSRFLRREFSEEVVAVKRKRRAELRDTGAITMAAQSGGAFRSWVLPLAVVALFGAWVASKARPLSVPADQMDLQEFGKLPVVYEGRVKPFDTLARNALSTISDYQTLVEKDDEPKDEGSDKKDSKTDVDHEAIKPDRSALRWFLDVITDSEDAEKHRIFRIQNLEVLNLLGLEPREGYHYAVGELRKKADEFNREVEKARKRDARQLSTYQKKLLELDQRVRAYTILSASFRDFPLPALPTPEELEKDPEKAARFKEQLSSAMRATQMLKSMHPPLAIPTKSDDEAWQSFTEGFLQAYIDTQIQGRPANPAVLSLVKILHAYARGDAAEFNRDVHDYRHALEASAPTDYVAFKTDFEAFFNRFAPFFLTLVLYVFVFLLVAIFWLLQLKSLRRTAICLACFAFLLHTVALIARIYISGRPPVTNLYSSAVFIGWGTVLLGLGFEFIFGLGIGTAVAALSGFATLLIAHFLAIRGDTFVVLQAVLDTQFWLATHVVFITLGYAATFLAGIFGVWYILAGIFPSLRGVVSVLLHARLAVQRWLRNLFRESVGLPPLARIDVEKKVRQMIYGTLCFAIFFSFVGTVLGGLWADDSWGRFWGWDPKENGALIIVLWNALVLHARWGGMVKDRGLAVLAVAGNITTSWSWFGVNELGVGLHSYGFTEGVIQWLAIVVVSQLAIIALGMAVPRHLWWSNAKHEQIAAL